MDKKIDNEKNYFVDTSLAYVNDNLNDLTELLTSGNQQIDSAIQSTQNHPIFKLSIIDYTEFSEVELIGRGGFSNVFKATYKSSFVALKVVEGSKNMTSYFLNELKSHQTCRCTGAFLYFYGISIEPSTRDYILVMDFMPKLDLRRNLTQRKEMIVLQELRPTIPDNLPQRYVNLMVRAWDQNPMLRPSAEEILSELWDWYVDPTIQKQYDQITIAADNALYNPELYTSKFIRTNITPYQEHTYYQLKLIFGVGSL
ncbi:11810_t:CDS:2 [Dentiscutata erythropus]|uniref:11810_t:CDS:1 n=1 Tax=Dentiscutata erythropus TaxID=1348616 RepID=A0A9N9IVW9_9GLOM|nr:11810_t:CDS:2 [Dentiscutata erythropus]